MRQNIHVLWGHSTTGRLWDPLEDAPVVLRVFIVLLKEWDQLYPHSNAMEDIIALEVQQHQRQLMELLEIFVRLEHTARQDPEITLCVLQEHSMRRMDHQIKVAASSVQQDSIVTEKGCQHRQGCALKDIIVQQEQNFREIYARLDIIALQDYRNHIYVHQECIKMREDNLNAKNVQLDIIVMLMINVVSRITPCHELVQLDIIA